MTTMTDLHQRYDGAIPERELAAAKAGGVENLQRKEAASAVWLMRDEARFFIRAIRNATTAENADNQRRNFRETWTYYRKAVARLRSLRVDVNRVISKAA